MIETIDLGSKNNYDKYQKRLDILFGSKSLILSSGRKRKIIVVSGKEPFVQNREKLTPSSLFCTGTTSLVRADTP